VVPHCRQRGIYRFVGRTRPSAARQNRADACRVAVSTSSGFSLSRAYSVLYACSGAAWHLHLDPNLLESCELSSRITDFLRDLLGARATEASHQDRWNTVEYKGYMIRPASRQEGSQWLTVGVISKQFADDVKEHHFIRADTYGTKQDADACSIIKAKQIIDEQGDKLFQDGLRS
jgi:hypothetical protein